ncbi:helix-turn-helix transcriptional regulator [Saccharothrix sp. NRRL B-16314]|uniref:helix-turn-helix transcriptional regulator n=1 Tax=Saccharothrix sp. NRRL B-16314 TaxID=1463825 RepID=UPI0005269F9C|nr:helix-turn-helix transcriptional regulator [Saccharothrix sp. NRRL B-16314]
MLYGRAEELAVVDRLLADARHGRSAAVVVRGEAGIGKSTLLDAAADRAVGMRVLRATGVEAESELPFAGLHLLLGPVIGGVDALPDRQAAALRGALGLDDGGDGRTDRFLVGLALLTLLADLAAERPLLCLVDDAHWLDSASTDAILFAARRLDADGVVLLLAARDRHAPDLPAHGLAELPLGRLDDAASAALLAAASAVLTGLGSADLTGLGSADLTGLGSADLTGLGSADLTGPGSAVLTGPASADLTGPGSAVLTGPARDRIVADAEGNPLALRVYLAAHRDGHQPGGVGDGQTRIRRTFSDRIADLPAATRAVLLLVAAEATDDLAVVLTATAEVGAALADLDPAERADLVRVTGGRVVFGHPLIRSAVYGGALSGERVAAHRALAAAHARVDHQDRRAWHLAAATLEPDDGVADLLERTARQARARGGCAAVAAAYERAAELSTRSADRVRRHALAAAAAADAGRNERAAELAALAAPHVSDPAVLARLAQVRAAVAREHGLLTTSHTLLADTAVAISAEAPDAAASMLFEAATAAWIADDRPALDDLAARLPALGVSPGAAGPPYLAATTGLAHLAAGELDRGLPPLRALLASLRGHGARLGLRERASIASWDLLATDPGTGHEIAAGLVGDCREEGAIGLLPLALMTLTRSRIITGGFRDALADGTEGVRIAQDTGQHHYVDRIRGLLAYLAAVRGDEEHCHSLAKSITRPNIVWSEYALGLLDLAHGRHESALGRLQAVLGRGSGHTMAALHSLPDHVEAAVGSGDAEQAKESLARLEVWADQDGPAWVRAVVLRCRALLATDDTAEALFAEAAAVHAADGRPFEQARTDLLRGEWLRRAGRRSAARGPLRAATDAFERLGATPWAARAHAELRATGETRPRPACDDLLGKLTPQERQVVGFAAGGLTNRDIGARLFLSPRTVGYHLSNAYGKLGVTSRGELAGLGITG